MQENHKERGFVLVSVVVITAILAMAGATAMFKSSIEVSVSASAVQGEQAFAAANAGLAKNFVYWFFDTAGGNEFLKVADDIEKKGTTSGILFWQDVVAEDDFPTPADTADLGANTAAIDAFIKGAANIRVYDITDNAMTETVNANWATGTDPQVAVWATSYQPPPPGNAAAYPYLAPNIAAGCEECSIVVYALGRSGNARRLLRELQATASTKLDGVSAMTNAPSYKDWQDMCDGTRTGTGTDFWGRTAGPPSKAVTWRAGEIHNADDLLVEATQAEYVTDVIPSGIALTSNTHLGGEGKNFRKGNRSTTIMSFDSVPMLAYSGHGPNAADNAMRVDQANRTQDNSTPALNLPDPPRKLPHQITNEPLLGTDEEIQYFPPNNPNEHLFDLDMYRWAAEQFTCQDESIADSTNGNGKYCSKAKKLRAAMGVAAPVTGRINMAEFEYNIANSIPMFGMTRVMYPVYDQGSLGNCASLGGAEVRTYDTNAPTALLAIGGAYGGDEVTLDADGSLGPNAKLIVYGSIFFDFFIDTDGDGFFDPGSGERLVNAFEAVDARMELEVPEYINPALPDIFAPLAFPTAAGGTIAVNSSAKDVNLASPTDGWFPASESRIPVSATSSEGAMELVDELVAVSVDMLPNSDGGGGQSFSASGAGAEYASHKNRLDYYYLLLRETARKSDSNSWPIKPASPPTSFSEDVCIGVDDCAVGNNDGDKFHLLFPSGYMHGWKVSLAALDVAADDWNDIFSNLPAIAASLDAGASGYDYGDAARPKGSPFNTSGAGLAAFSDMGFARALDVNDLQADQNKYFFVTKDASGYGLLDGDWMDIPAQIYAGGLVDIHHYNNMSGLVYTPGPLEWETGHTPGATGYVNAAIITGFGTFTETDGTTNVILVYDNQAVDNINTKTVNWTLRRSAWQGLQ